MEQTKLVCQLDENNYFVHMTNADLCPIEKNIYHIPGGAIDVPPPVFENGTVARWTGSNWEYQKDYRGTAVFNKQTGDESSISDLGDIPSDFTVLPRPDKYHVWDETRQSWQTNNELQQQKVIDWRNSVAEITPKQLRLVLLSNNIKSHEVESAIAQIDDEYLREVATIEWNYATGYQRTNANLVMIATQLLGLTDEQIDAMWLDALIK